MLYFLSNEHGDLYFYCVIIVYVLYSLIKKKLKKIIGRKKDRAEKHDSRMQIMISKTMTRKTLYVHVVLNGVILKQIYMVLFYMLETVTLLSFSRVL